MLKERHSCVCCGALLLLLAELSACGASASATSTGAPPHPLVPRAPDAVVVLTAPPTGNAAIEIGRIDASSGAHGPLSNGKREVLDALRKTAGENGCDSILVSNTEESLFATSNGTPMYKTHQHAVCFVNR